jgi:hypothetical protein
MKKTFAFAAIATLMATPAFAGEDVAMADIDANADGFLTLEEVQAHKPDVSAKSFADWDVNGDAQLSEAEFAAWKKAASEDYGKPIVNEAEDTAADALDDAGEALDDAGEAMTDAE